MNQRIIKIRPLILFMIMNILALSAPGCNSVPEGWGTPNPDYVVLVDTSSCWNGICPGQTTREDAEQLLQSLPFKGSSEIEKTESENKWVLFFDNQQFEGSWVTVEFEDSGEVVKSVRINLGRKELTMEQVVDLLGEPQQVIVKASSNGDSAASFANYGIWYPNLGLYVWSAPYNSGRNPKPSQIILHPTLASTGFEYVGTKEGKEQLLDSLMMSLAPYQRPEDKQELEKFFHPWSGFNNSVPSFFDYDRYRP